MEERERQSRVRLCSLFPRASVCATGEASLLLDSRQLSSHGVYCLKECLCSRGESVAVNGSITRVRISHPAPGTILTIFFLIRWRFSGLSPLSLSSAGSANVPIVGIKRVGREGNTVSVTAAGRGTIGFEPQVRGEGSVDPSRRPLARGVRSCPAVVWCAPPYYL